MCVRERKKEVLFLLLLLAGQWTTNIMPPPILHGDVNDCSMALLDMEKVQVSLSLGPVKPTTAWENIFSSAFCLPQRRNNDAHSIVARTHARIKKVSR